ncbi:prepilin-type N-terminal cleavage/methylation domain-containing protein [Gemmata sp.]|uniref:prepilin-type N-terminal cleavage/methylation domain-containing protein n=1 Tax=Gemmata sp. TaxID=1914242 RepID=UPI003F70C799
MLLTTVQTTRRSAMRRAGFTLLEVLVVVAILVILAGVASISVFRYLEDAKVGRAKNDMLAIKKSYETFYTQQSRWPQDPSEVTPLLEQGAEAFQSPWPGVTYQATVEEVPQSDGTSIQRVYVMCQPPNKPQIVVPDVNSGR